MDGILSLLLRFLVVLVILGILVIFLGQAEWSSEAFSSFRHNVAVQGHRLVTAYQTQLWETEQSEHFIIKYKPEDRDIVPLVKKTAELAYPKIAVFLKYEAPRPIMLIIYPDRQELNQVFGWSSEQSAMGAYWQGIVRITSPKDWISSSDYQQMPRIFETRGPVMHELTHFFVDHLTHGNCPRWLNEGLALHVEKHFNDYSPRYPVEQGKILKLQELEAGFDEPSVQQEAYWNALMVVNYFIEKYGAAKMHFLLKELAEGKPIIQAYREITGNELQELELVISSKAA